MNERDPRSEAADIARSLRRMVERERAQGGGELLATGVARARAAGLPEFSTPVVHSAPAAPPLETAPEATPTLTTEPAAEYSAAPTPTSDASATSAPAGFELTPPEPMPSRTPTPSLAPANGAREFELPPFAEDLNPAGLADARASLFTSSLPLLKSVASEVKGCEKCGLCRTRTNTVPGVGSARSGIVFVGEAPGADEDAKGEPFVGRAGELLTRMIAGMDERQLIPGVKLDRENVYICNVLKCRPPENRNPLPHEIESCSPYLLRQLDALKPRVICCLGKFAAELLLSTKGTVGGMRGKTWRWQGAKLIVTYHPAYLLRNPNAKREVWEDLQRLAREYLTD